MVKKIKISKIEKDMLFIGTRLAIVESLISILINLLCNGDSTKAKDVQAMSFVLSREFVCAKKRFNKLEKRLNI